MSTLLFVRDGRRLPFVPVTLAAMDAIRRQCDKGRPYATATYMALLEMANEQRSDRVPISQKAISDLVGAARATVQRALSDLVTAGVLQVVERTHAGGRLENEYVLIEPQDGDAESCTPASQEGDPRPPERQHVELEEEEEERTTSSLVAEVFSEWLKATDRNPARFKLSGDRKRFIERALKSHGLEDCVAAVRNIGADPWAGGANDRGRPFNDIRHALGTAEQIERWRDQTPGASNVRQPPRRQQPILANGRDLRRFENL